jgi:histidinol dehydrogenase
MRILELTESRATRLLAARKRRGGDAERVAARIIADVRRRGDAALLDWSRRLDAISYGAAREIWVGRREIQQARRDVSPELLRALAHAARNIRRVAAQQKPIGWNLKVEPGVRVGQLVRPLGAVGCYVPGGQFALVSTLLMTVIPAQVAGVPRIIVVCPRPNAAVLAAADLLRIHEVARVGGAQAIAALAYGTRSVPQVDKICGPGNRFVTAAKRLVSSDCAIDLLAGPTELLVVAARGNPRFIAADLIAQAEHDPDALALLVTPSRRLANLVAAEAERQLALLPGSNPAHRSLSRNGVILLAQTLTDAVAFANRFAPEHLSLPAGEQGILNRIAAAGSVFLGAWSAQPLGDYATGSNHTLPTGAWATARGGLSVADYVKCIAVQRISRRGFLRLAPVARALARAESLAAHARAVEVRV